MRLIFTTIALLMSMMLSAQVPALIPYQAIARNAAGAPLASSTINARFTIHDGTANGASVWQELQTVATSTLGLFTVQLGSSVSLGSVNWASGAKFMQVEIDLDNGFVDIGTQQLLSVPYALHSSSATTVQFSISDFGDTLSFGDGRFIILNGLSNFNPNGGIAGIQHTCGAPNLHNPNLTYGTMADQEGNLYKTIVIGTQEWMAENLNTSIYSNGESIPTGLSNSEWADTLITQQGAWAYFENDSSNACPYGKLYNWYTCVDTRQLCPVGWHVPTDDEWTVLTSYLGGVAAAGGKMKTTGIRDASTGLWWAPNPAASNRSGFSGAPGGYRYGSGEYDHVVAADGHWWSSSESGTFNAWYRYLSYFFGNAGRDYSDKRSGFSVRCLRD